MLFFYFSFTNNIFFNKLMQDYSWVFYLHILFVGPLLIYLGIQKNNVPDFVYIDLIVMGVFVMAYHGYKLYNYLNK